MEVDCGLLFGEFCPKTFFRQAYLMCSHGVIDTLQVKALLVLVDASGYCRLVVLDGREAAAQHGPFWREWKPVAAL